MHASDETSGQSLVPTDQAPRVTDRELLSRFVTLRDEEAFRLLVTRHSGLVWSVCQRMLSCHQDREDVFQATFLRLVRHARKNGWRASIAGWLYKVAYRLSLSLRAAQKRRNEQGLDPAEEPYVNGNDSLEAIQRQDMELALHAALSELPPIDREAIVLCYLQNRSHEMAAVEIGCSVAALNGRLQRGRRRLLRSLAGRGLSLTCAMAAMEKTLQAAPHWVPTALLERTVATGIGSLAGKDTVAVSSQVSALCKGEIGRGATSMVAVQSTAAMACLAAFWLASSGVLYSILSSSTVVYAAPQLLTHMIASGMVEQDETSAELAGSEIDDAKGRQILRSSSERVATLLNDSQEILQEVMGKYRAVVAFHQRPKELTLDLLEFDRNLFKLEKACEGEIKKLEQAWHDLQQMPKASAASGEHLEVARTALESVILSLSDAFQVNLTALAYTNILSNSEPGNPPTDWDVQEMSLYRLADALEAGGAVLDVVAANLPESPAAGQSEIIERNLVKLREIERDNRAWESIPWYSKTRFKEKVPLSQVIEEKQGFDTKDFELENKLLNALQELKGVHVNSHHKAKVDEKQLTHLYLDFDAISEQKREQALEKLQTIPGVKTIVVNRGKGNLHSWGGSVYCIWGQAKSIPEVQEIIPFLGIMEFDVRAIPLRAHKNKQASPLYLPENPQ